MKQYQYELLLLDDYGGTEGVASFPELTRRLNEVAQLGWEVVSVTETTVPRDGKRGLLATLKRELPG